MVSPNAVNGRINKYCKHVAKCGKTGSNRCQGCGQLYCTDHYLRHQTNLQKKFKHILHTQDSMNQQLKSLISELSADAILDLIKEIHEYKMKSDEVEKRVKILQQQLQDLINDDRQDLKKHLNTTTNGSESDQNNYLETDIQYLRKDTKQLKLKLEEMNNYAQKRSSQEDDVNVQSDNPSKITEPPLMNLVTSNKSIYLQPVANTPNNSVPEQANRLSVINYILLRQLSPLIIDQNESELNMIEINDEVYPEGEEEMTGVIDSNGTSTTAGKIRLSNNIITYLRGPLKVMLDGTMHAMETRAADEHASNADVQAVQKGLARQRKTAMQQPTSSYSITPAFADITEDWTFEEENPDRGFTSVSIWLRDPQGRRILAKIQDHPLAAANEWLAYALGKLIGFPVNETQIGIYRNDLVSLHTDVAQENEKTLTLMDLPKQLRETLSANSIIKSMHLFDRITQNVDRNPRNILITMPKDDNNDDTSEMKVCFIDHSSSFGVGKLNAISVIATKLHWHHFSVVKFNPIEKARKFEVYLSKLSGKDRMLMRKTLNRFAAITDKQFDRQMMEIQDLLSSGQYSRIRGVLYRQRDIVKRYMEQWGLSARPSYVQSNETNRITVETNDTVDYF